MPINLEKTQYVSTLSGFKNKFGYTVASSFAGYSLPTGQFIALTTTLTFVNPGSVIGDISSVQLKLDGLETFWRTIEGYLVISFPNSAAPQYEMGINTFFTATTHTIYIYMVNQTGGTVNIPAFTLRYKLNTFDTPF